MSTRTTSGDFSYLVTDDWIRVGSDGNRAGGPSHGVQVLNDGRIAVFHQNAPGDKALLFFDADGKHLGGTGDYPGAHGLSLVSDGFWVTDEKTSVVHKLDPEGNVVRTLEAPPAEVIADAANEARRKYVPTWADETSDGTTWVADGYGTHRVYRYDADGKYVGFIDGSEGAGRFKEPHGLRVSPAGELWITDRSNRRVCVYTADGKFLRHTDTACNSPAAFAFHDGLCYVAEIAGSVKILDNDLNLLATLAQSPDITPLTRDAAPGWVPAESQRPDGWPDVPEDKLPAGHCHTPHGIDVAEDGTIYVAEWYKGGRILKLQRV